MKKKVLSVALAFLMTAASLPTLAFAHEGGMDVCVCETACSEDYINEDCEACVTEGFESCAYEETSEEDNDETSGIEAILTLIDSLPDAEDISLENAENVLNLIEKIVDAMALLDEEEEAQLDLTKFEAALEKLNSLDEAETYDGESVTEISNASAFNEYLTQTDSKWYLNQGNYNLTGNVMGSAKTIYINGTVKIDLNGYILSENWLIVNNGGSLTIKDSASNSSGCVDAQIENNGTFTLESGTIEINNAPIVTNAGTFNMNGGKITGANGTNEKGGGVYNTSSGNFTMTDGTIENCKSYNGGGVYNEGKFTMSGGTIDSCEAKKDNSTEETGNGGGVYAGNTFNTSGGTISNCVAQEGGGVYISGCTFTMSGGNISQCSTSNTGAGGGVCNSSTSDSKFIMQTGAEIYSCSAAMGGGVYNYNKFEMQGGIIGSCCADSQGGGLYNRGSFTMGTDTSSASITGGSLGTSEDKNGLCIYQASGSIEIKNGTVSVTEQNQQKYTIYINTGTFTIEKATIVGQVEKRLGKGEDVLSNFCLVTFKNGAETIEEAYYGTEKLTAPTDPKKDGKTFGGWYVTKDGNEQKWDFDSYLIDSYKVKNDGDICYTLTLNAHWVCTVDFDKNGGSGSMTSVTTDENGKFALPNCEFTAPTGSEFDYWATKNGDTYTKVTADEDGKCTVTANTTLYAVWKAETYTVKFVWMDRGTEGTHNYYDFIDTVEYNGKITDHRNLTTPPSDALSKKAFGGWYKHTGTAGFVKWNFEADTVTENIELYAFWVDPVATVSYMESNDSKTENYGDVFIAVEEACKKERCVLTLHDGYSNVNETLKFTGGKVTLISNDRNLETNITVEGGATLKIASGNFGQVQVNNKTTTSEVVGGKLEINGGTFGNCVTVYMNGTLEITNGTFNGTEQSLYVSQATGSISGGTFKGKVTLNDVNNDVNDFGISGGSYKEISVSGTGLTLANVVESGYVLKNGESYADLTETSCAASGSSLISVIETPITNVSLKAYKNGSEVTKDKICYYDEVEFKPSYATATTTSENATVSFSWKIGETVSGETGQTFTYTVNPVTLGSSTTDSRTITCTVTVDGYSVEEKFTFVPNKATPTVTAPTANTGLKYNGSPHTLLAGGSTTGGTLKYRLEGESTWSETIPTGTEPKTYKVQYMVEGNDYYSTRAADGYVVTVTIDKVTPVYSGNPIAVKVKKGTVLNNISIEGFGLSFSGINGNTLSGDCTWVDGTKTIDKSTTEQIKFTPNDDHYEEATVDVSINIKKSSNDGGGTDYFVKFETDGGDKVMSQTVKENTEMSVKDPEKEGFVFGGWYTDKELTKKFDPDTKITGDLTLYAKWIEIENKTEDNTEKDDKPDESTWESPYADVKEDDWFYEDVKKVTQKGLMVGISDNEFGAYEPVTRGMFAAILYRLENEPEVSGSLSHKDVSESAYYAKAIKWAYDNGILSGYSDDVMAPDDKITREQLATILFRYAKLKGTLPEGAWAIYLGYSDTSEISDYAVEAVMYCKLKGIMLGKDDNSFAPKAFATRGEIAAIFNRI